MVEAVMLIRRAWLWVSDRTGIYRWEDDPRTVALREDNWGVRFANSYLRAEYEMKRDRAA